MSRPVEALVVDLGGVAARFRPERRLCALASATGLEAGLIHERLFESGFDHGSELGEHSVEQALAGVRGARLSSTTPLTSPTRSRSTGVVAVNP